jgi:hypothetical protein
MGGPVINTSADCAAALESADLKCFLRACPEDEVETLARLIVAANGPKYPHDRHLQISLEERALRGHYLIRDIADDIINFGSYSAVGQRSYREIVGGVCERHGISDDETISIAELERQLLLKYEGKLGGPGPIEDRGSNPVRTRLLPSMISPNWNVVTTAVVRIGVMRVVNWARSLRAGAAA